MALSNSQYESIMRVYNRTQLQKKHELDARVDEVYEKIPAVREMNDAIAAAAVNWGFGLLIEKRHKRVFLVLALVLRMVTKEDLALVPKGEKIAKILHIR